MTEEIVILKDFTQILGSGGFGLVVYNPKDDIVAKLFYQDSKCREASEEAKYHKKVYDQYIIWKMYHNSDQINVIKPIGYRNNPVIWSNKKFKCSYLMNLIKPIPGFDSLVHIRLKEEQKHLFNRKVGRIYNQPISDTNPSRGFFATCDYITENILGNSNINSGNIRSCSDLARNMGILFGICIFGAHMIPKDAEYVLSYSDSGMLFVTLLDFGMFEPMELTDPSNKEILDKYIFMCKFDIAEIDIYFPYESIIGEDDSKEPELYNHLLSGIRDASEFFIENEKNQDIKTSLEYIIQKISEPSSDIYSPIKKYTKQYTHKEPLVLNIEKQSLKNNSFRSIIKTNVFSQIVLMSLKPNEEIGMEKHNVDQFIRIEKGNGVAILDNKKYNITDGSAVIIPAGVNHNIINLGKTKLKLYTIYSPPEHDSDI